MKGVKLEMKKSPAVGRTKARYNISHINVFYSNTIGIYFCQRCLRDSVRKKSIVHSRASSRATPRLVRHRVATAIRCNFLIFQLWKKLCAGWTKVDLEALERRKKLLTPR